MYHIFPSYHYYEHPTDPNYLIFTLRRKDMADYFEEKISDTGIKFEKDTDINRQNKELFHFAVLQSSRQKSLDLYLETWSKFRKPFFSNPTIKIILLALTFSLITLAVIGFIKNS